MNKVLAFIFLILLNSAFIKTKTLDDEEPTPIVLWHGMGDTCCSPSSIGKIKSNLEESIPGVYVLSLQIGNNTIDEIISDFFMHPDDQIKEACEIIEADPKLANGFNAIGFSQGAQFLRGVVQRCSSLKVKNLISVGGQHQGVYGLPNCATLLPFVCDEIRKLISDAVYLESLQDSFVQATYWHDPLHEDVYKNHSSFLADINNENGINQQYVDNLIKLENFVLILFENDTMVQPVESEWFGFYSPGQSEEILPLESSPVYERLGLKTLGDSGRLHYVSVEGKHLKFEWSWFEENIVQKYLIN